MASSMKYREYLCWDICPVLLQEYVDDEEDDEEDEKDKVYITPLLDLSQPNIKSYMAPQ